LGGVVQILFVSGVAPIVSDESQAHRFYVDDLGLPLTGEDYVSSDHLPGTRHFGVWPLRMAAESCFGTDAWPTDLPIPQASVELELASVDAVTEAADELVQKGYALLHGARMEPWGQTVARLQTPDGLLIGLSHAPWMHA
jgi:catechol 2,3-dioxygenase-like lactoylglutathione lyase family enzyme